MLECDNAIIILKDIDAKSEIKGKLHWLFYLHLCQGDNGLFTGGSKLYSSKKKAKDDAIAVCKLFGIDIENIKIRS